MWTLYYGPGACSMASHIALEEAGAKYEGRPVALAKGEQRTPDYLKINPNGKVPALKLDDGTVVTENVAILPFVAKTHPQANLLPKDPLAESRALSIMGFFASSVHIAFAHIARPERWAKEESALPGVKEKGREAFHGYLKQIDGMLEGRQWFLDQFSVVDGYSFVFYTWGKRIELPVQELKHYTAHRERMMQRPAVQRMIEQEGLKLN